jgi:hypothetical protein
MENADADTSATRNLYFDDVGMPYNKALSYSQSKHKTSPKNDPPTYRARLNFFSALTPKFSQSNDVAARNLYYEDLFSTGAYSLSRFFFKSKYEADTTTSSLSKENERIATEENVIFETVDSDTSLISLAKNQNDKGPLRIRMSGSLDANIGLVKETDKVKELVDESSTTEPNSLCVPAGGDDNNGGGEIYDNSSTSSVSVVAGGGGGGGLQQQSLLKSNSSRSTLLPPILRPRSGGRSREPSQRAIIGEKSLVVVPTAAPAVSS